MRYERQVKFEERAIVIETEEERLSFNKMIQMACNHYSCSLSTSDSGMYNFVCGIRSGN